MTVSKPTNNHTVRHPTEIVIRREPTNNGEGRLQYTLGLNPRENVTVNEQRNGSETIIHQNKDQDSRRPNSVKNVTVSDKKMERLEITPLENLAEELAGVEYTIRKKSLLKRQLRDLKKKLAGSLPVIEEETYEN